MQYNDLGRLVGIQPQQNVSDQLFHKISELILSGQLPEGYAFPNETVLCEQLQVGRTTLREAYKALELSGYVTRTKRGTTVNSRTTILNSTPLKTAFSTASSRDFNEFRLMLESESACLAAKRISLDEINTLEQYMELSHKARQDEDYDELLRLDRCLHSQIAEASRNSLVSTTVIVMNETLETVVQHNFITALRNNQSIFDQMLVQHQKILEALRARDCAAARTAMVEHIVSVTNNNS